VSDAVDDQAAPLRLLIAVPSASDKGQQRHTIAELRRANSELVRANSEPRVERDAADVLLGAAMDELLEVRGS
jgi:hypothetical protein